MAETPELGRRRLLLDGDWGLIELSSFGRQYTQIYSLLYALNYELEDEEMETIHDPFIDETRVQHAFRAFPWKGGWSAVDFYDSLRVAVPKRFRPRIVEIQYASPGHLTLELAAKVALEISGGVLLFAKSINELNSAYRNIQKGFIDRKLNKINLRSAELKLRKDEQEFVDSSLKRLADAMQLKHTPALTILSPSKPVALKILLSLFRRYRDLAKLQKAGKIRF